MDRTVVHDDRPLTPAVLVLDFLDDGFHVGVKIVSIDGCGVNLEMEHPTSRNRDDCGDSADPCGEMNMLIEVLGKHDSDILVSGFESHFVYENDIVEIWVLFRQFLELQSIIMSLLQSRRMVPTEGASP